MFWIDRGTELIPDSYRTGVTTHTDYNTVCLTAKEDISALYVFLAKTAILFAQMEW